MRLNWKGYGQKHYIGGDLILRLNWNHNESNYSVYCLKSFKEDGSTPVILLFRVYDFAWQESLWRPRLDWIRRMLWHMEHSFSFDEKFYESAYFHLTQML